jgi:hypothetical protein
MIVDIFKFGGGARSPRGVLTPDLVDGVASSNWLPDASARMLHRVFRPVRTRIEGGPAFGEPLHNQANPENEARFHDTTLKHDSHPFARHPMFGHPSSPSRVRFAAHTTRALDGCGRATRSPGYERKGSCRKDFRLM